MDTPKQQFIYNLPHSYTQLLKHVIDFTESLLREEATWVIQQLLDLMSLCTPVHHLPDVPAPFRKVTTHLLAAKHSCFVFVCLFRGLWLLPLIPHS